MTQQELAQASGVSVRFLGQLEAGSGNISLGKLGAIARGVGASMGQLVDEAPSALAPVEGLSSEALDKVRALLRSRSSEEVMRALELASSLLDVQPGVRVALLGIRGAGKTSVGVRVATKLDVPFIELDALIEQLAGLSLGSIFELHGEGYYRRLERQALLSLLSRPSFVVATGGSIVSSDESYALLRSACQTVWLKSTPEDLWSRVVAQGDGRPMRENPRAMDELRALVDARAPLYARAALTIDTEGRSVAQIVTGITKQVRART